MKDYYEVKTSTEKEFSDLVERCILGFNCDYYNDEKAVRKIFSLDDNSEEIIFARVIVLNQLYSTRLDSYPPNNTNSTGSINLSPLYEYIDISPLKSLEKTPKESDNNKEQDTSQKKKNCDIRTITNILVENDLEKVKNHEGIVDWINVIKNKDYFTPKEKDNKGKTTLQLSFPYSFLTKYCSWYFEVKGKAEEYNIPIYDGYVAGMLYRWKKEKKFKQVELLDYGFFCNVFNEIKNEINVITQKEYTNKQIDQFLWYFAKMLLENGVNGKKYDVRIYPSSSQKNGTLTVE